MNDVAAKAFLSYAHSDDAREGGRIRRLAEKITAEYELLTGMEIEIFVDSAELKWGQDFRDQLDQALQETTFFIPVLTPTYFSRNECRKEMMRFVTSAQSLGLQQLLMSIRYTPVPGLDEDSSDELMAIAARMQFEPWDDVRLLEEDSSAYRIRINQLAARLVELTRALETTPNHTDTTPVQSATDLLPPRTGSAQGVPPVEQRVRETPQGSGSDDGSDEERELGDDEPGLLDLVSDFEPVTNEWKDVVVEIPPTLREFTELFNDTSEEMAAANKKPNSFAAKIVIARKLAANAEEPLSKMERLSKEYSTILLRLDPIIRAYIEMVNLSSEPEDKEKAITMVRDLIEASKNSAKAVTGAADMAGKHSKMSRDLRPVLRRLETAMRNMADGQELIESWEPLLDEAS